MTGNGKERLIIPGPCSCVGYFKNALKRSTHTEYSTGRCCFVVFSFLGLDKIKPLTVTTERKLTFVALAQDV